MYTCNYLLNVPHLTPSTPTRHKVSNQCAAAKATQLPKVSQMLLPHETHLSLTRLKVFGLYFISACHKRWTDLRPVLAFPALWPYLRHYSDTCVKGRTV